MDPTQFHINWDVLLEALTLIIILSFFIERALSLIFEHRLFVERYRRRGFKEPIAFATSLAVVWIWHFDVMSIAMMSDEPMVVGYIVTAAVVAGGSKASIKLFHDVLGVKSSSAKARQEKETKERTTG